MALSFAQLDATKLAQVLPGYIKFVKETGLSYA